MYRLAVLESCGLVGYDRHAYRNLDRALNAAQDTGTPVGITRKLGVDDDIVVVDGEWTRGFWNGYPQSGRYERDAQRPRGTRAERNEAPRLEGSTLIAESQPPSWIGKTFLDRQGSGAVWNGVRMVKVERYRMRAVDRTNEDEQACDGLYAGAVRATFEWWRQGHKEQGAHVAPAVLSLLTPAGVRLGAMAQLPFEADYLLLLPTEEEQRHWPATGPYVREDGTVRPPRRLSAVSDATLEKLHDLDLHEPRPTHQSYYRWTRVTPDGVVAIDHQVFTAADKAERPPQWVQYPWSTDRRALCRTRGLPADARTIDGREFISDVERVEATKFDEIVRACNLEVGGVVTDRNGKGMLFDGRTLLPIEQGRVASPGNPEDGADIWAVATLKRAQVTPEDVNVHGVLIPMEATEAKGLQLPYDVRGILFLRGRPKTRAHAIPLTTEDLAALRKKSLQTVDLRGLDAPHRRAGWSTRYSQPVPAAPTAAPTPGQPESSLPPAPEPAGGEPAPKSVRDEHDETPLPIEDDSEPQAAWPTADELAGSALEGIAPPAPSGDDTPEESSELEDSEPTVDDPPPPSYPLEPLDTRIRKGFRALEISEEEVEAVRTAFKDRPPRELLEHIQEMYRRLQERASKTDTS